MLTVHWYRRSTRPEGDIYAFRPQWDDDYYPDARKRLEAALEGIGWEINTTAAFHADETPEEMLVETDRIMSAEFGDIDHRTSVPHVLQSRVPACR